MARHRLRARREALGLSQQDVAEALEASPDTVSRYELGKTTPRPRQRRRYAEILHWSPTELALAMHNLDAAEPNGHAAPSWLGHLAHQEQMASEVWAWEPFVVHGLLQTAEYAAAVEHTDPDPIGDDEVSRRVETRLARQGALDRSPDPLGLSVVLDESVLTRVAGGRDVMADQLRHLVEIADRPNIDLRVLPLDAGGFAAAFGAFSVLTSGDSRQPSLVYTKDRIEPHYIDDSRPHDLGRHVALFEHLACAALSPSDSTDLISDTAKDYL